MMIEKIILSAGISLLIFLLMSYINYKWQNRILFKINKSILQSAMMYFTEREIEESENEKFRNFAKSRIADLKLEDWLLNFDVKVNDENKLVISYKFRRSESEVQPIEYEISKNFYAPENEEKETGVEHAKEIE